MNTTTRELKRIARVSLGRGETNAPATCIAERQRERAIWRAIKYRCTNPKAANFKYYGGRGITVCDRWLESFDAFFEDMGPRPQGHSIDRIDNYQGYHPGNCRWATHTQQNCNQRRGPSLSSGVFGVLWHARDRAWIAKGQIQKIHFSLYYGKSFERAVRARQVFEQKTPFLLEQFNSGMTAADLRSLLKTAAQ